MKPIEMLGQVAASMKCKASYDESMKVHTTFKIGGPADLFVTVDTQNALAALLKKAKELEVPFRVIGKGSNLLVHDLGIRGMVILLDGEFSRLERVGENQIHCGASVPLSSLCSFAQKQSLAGLEFAWGIPGSAGGAAFMNAGAYGSEMKNVLVSCTHMAASGEVVTLPAENLELSYRHSVYEHLDAVILSLLLELKPGNRTEITAKMEDFIHRRKEKQPLEYPSAGSVFKRPEGYFAGSLIEQCGLKGTRIGGAMVSEKHAGFIVNTGDATCEDVLNLIQLIQDTVRKETGVSLECEVKAIQ